MLRAHAIALAALTALAAPARSATFEGFDDFLARLQAAAPPARTELIRDYLADQRTRGGFPVVEKDGVVFVYLGTGTEKAVRLVGEMKLRNFNSVLWDEQGEPLTALGTLFYGRMRFEPDARLQYQFAVDGKFVNDALNPRTFISGAAPGAGKEGIAVSDLIMPAYRVSALAVPRAGAPAGRTVTLDEPWATPRVNIHLPVGYDPARRYPVLYIADGWSWARTMGLPTIVDNLTADGAIEPVIAVFIDPTDDRPGWYQFRSPYVAYLEKVIGWVDSHFSTRPGPSGRLHVGASAGGRAGLAVVLERPDLFANTALFSPSLFAPLHYLEPYMAGRKRPDRRLRVWLSAGSYEGYIHADALVLERYLRARGVALATAYTHEGHSFAAYRNLAGDMLRFFFPARPR